MKPEFELGQLVTVWVDDLDPIVKRRYKDKFGLIKEITYTEQSNRDGRPSFIKVFFPDTNTYDLERILSEVSAAYWRFDPGPATGSAGYLGENPVLISSFGSASFTNANNYIYSGHNINANSMQISASLNLFGIQRVLQEEEDSFGKKLKNIKKC